MIIGSAAALVSAALLALIMFLLRLPEQLYSTAALCALGIGAFAVSLTYTRRSRDKGLFKGIIGGLTAFLPVALVCLFVSGGDFSDLPGKLAVCLVGGAVGGIIGVNTR